MIRKFEWHGEKVTGFAELLGNNSHYNLCYTCKKFDPEGNNCLIADKLYKLCKKHTISIPVMICKKYRKKKTK